jgi:hypothetical protein
VSVPFYTFIGCAVSADHGESFSRVSPAPVVERGPHDPFLTTSPWVLLEDGIWRLWYASGTGWSRDGDRRRHFYNVKYAESSDGVTWQRSGVTCIDFAHASEYATLGHASLTTESCIAWSRRGDAHQIGYAESHDGIEWKRKDAEVGIDARGRMGLEDDRVPVCVRLRRSAIHALQRQRLRSRDRARCPGQDD